MTPSAVTVASYGDMTVFDTCATTRFRPVMAVLPGNNYRRASALIDAGVAPDRPVRDRDNVVFCVPAHHPRSGRDRPAGNLRNQRRLCRRRRPALHAERAQAHRRRCTNL
jgi:hypothetical protein